MRVGLAVSFLVVLLLSVLLARFLSVENAERDKEVALLQAQARGDLGGMLAQLSGCRESPPCLAAAKADVSNPRLRRSGAVKVLQIQSPTAYSLSGATGRTRLAWTVIGTLPVVQCVEVRRTGNFLLGIDLHLIAISAPIDNEGKCHSPSAIEREEEAEAAAAGR